MSIAITAVCVIASLAMIILILSDALPISDNGESSELLTPKSTTLLSMALILIVSVSLLLLSLFYRPACAVVAPPAQAKEEPATERPTIVINPDNDSPAEMPQEEQDKDDHIISRLLSGDERRIYQMIAAAGGEMLQMDIAAKKVFSKPKITRLLTKLEQRGLIVRERHGFTNRIKLVK